jgi:hypothetical protein
MHRLILFFLCLSVAEAQIPVAPSPESADSSDGETNGNYNIVNNSEVGYRFHTVGGNSNQYRSSVNYGNGVRVLASSLAVNSVDGRGTLLDHMVLNTQGLGNDPYQSAQLRAERNALYKYDLGWRQNDYFNPGLLTAGGNSQHMIDTTYRMQDHNLTILPQSKYKFFFGHTGSAQLGPAFTTEQGRAGAYQFLNVRRRWNEYRIGNEFRVVGIRVNWTRGWEDFKEDEGFAPAPAGVPGFPANPANANLLSLDKRAPYHGTSPYWRVGLFTGNGRFDVNGRFTYTAGRRKFVFDETAVTTAVPGGAQTTTKVFTEGDAQRPVATGNLNIGFRPSSKLSLINSTAVYNARTQGDSAFTQFSPVQLPTTFFYNYLGIRTVANDTVLNYQVSNAVGFYAGYQYSDRLINSVERTDFGDQPARQTSILNSSNFGIRLRAWQALTIQFGAEIGRANRPFTPVDPRHYHALNGRVQYRTRNLQVTAAAKTDYNNNSVTLSSYSSRARRYAMDGSWTRLSWLALDAGYSKLHFDSVGGIAYRVGAPVAPNGTLITGESSLYFSNLHTVYFAVRFALKKRAELYAGLTRVQDTGDGRNIAAGSGLGSPREVFQVVQTFPLTFQSPMARVSVKINNNLRWNGGYQYYGHHQEFNPTLNNPNPNLGYRANTGYTSLSISF